MDASHQHRHRHYPRQQPDHQHQPQLQYRNNNVKTLSTKPKSQHQEIRLISVLLRKIKKTSNKQVSRGGICPCRHCRRQCKIFASGVNFSIFTHFLCFFPTKTVEIRWNWRCKTFSLKIRRCKFLENSMSALSRLWNILNMLSTSPQNIMNFQINWQRISFSSTLKKCNCLKEDKSPWRPNHNWSI